MGGSKAEALTRKLLLVTSEFNPFVCNIQDGHPQSNIPNLIRKYILAILQCLALAVTDSTGIVNVTK